MKINVGVIFGGESVEHEISIISAMQAIKAIDESKYNVIPIYVSKKRNLYYSPTMTEIKEFTNLDEVKKNSEAVYLINEDDKVTLRSINKKWLNKKFPITIDLIIPIMHGTNGEDGAIQGYLEMLRVPYVGCDVIAAGVGQDKVIMKYVLQGNGLPLCEWFWLYGNEYNERKEQILSQANKLGYPVIIKPACLGSSIGIQFVHDSSELENAIKEASKYDRKLVIEKVINDLEEINCSVLGDSFSCLASSLEKVLKNEEILSYQDKYVGNSKSKGSAKGMAATRRIYPAPLDQQQTTKIKQLAVEVFKAVGASGVCRIDFMIDKANDKIYVNEINTIPGSLAFYLWEDSGINFTALMDRLFKQAIDRERRKEKMIYSYDTNILAGYSGGLKGKAKG